MAGLDFFRKAVELQRRLNVNRVQVYNSIQTNGLLLDSQWAAFFRENHFLVGLSLDGMKDTHDLYRLDAQGQGTPPPSMWKRYTAFTSATAGGICNLFLAWTPWARSREARPTP